MGRGEAAVHTEPPPTSTHETFSCDIGRYWLYIETVSKITDKEKYLTRAPETGFPANRPIS